MKKLITFLLALAVLTSTVFMFVLPAAAEEKVSYRYPVYKNGDAKQGIDHWEEDAKNCIKVTSSDTQWNSGWYVVEGSITIKDSVKCKGNVNLILKSGSYLAINAESTDDAGIVVSDDKDDGNVTSTNTLTIYTQSSYTGNATLVAVGGGDCAGIGGSDGESGEHITINGGAIYAYGCSDAAGIGGGDSGGDAHDIIINDGYVFAGGGRSSFVWKNGLVYDFALGDDGAGIGGGWHGDGYDIIINGGVVKAYAGLNSAGIGGGSGASGYNITINDGDVEAIGGSSEVNGFIVSDDGGAGIGGGADGEGHDITINGGSIAAYGRNGSAGIGGGEEADGHDITINNGSVYVKGGRDGAGIGGGESNAGYKITINGGYIETTGGENGAGIGGGVDGTLYGLTINGGTIYATGGSGGAGIGGGADGPLDGLTINGGTIYATGTNGGAGIGGGDGSYGTNISIQGGKVTARASWEASGIGGGRDSHCGNIWIGAKAIVNAYGNKASGIGNGYEYDDDEEAKVYVDKALYVFVSGVCVAQGVEGSPISNVFDNENNSVIYIGKMLAEVHDIDSDNYIYCNSIYDALKATSNGSITLYADIWTSSITIPKDKIIYLCLDGHNIYGNGKNSVIVNNGTLEISGSGTISGGKADNGGNICNNGIMTIKSGVTVTGGNATNGGNIYNKGELDIYSGIVSEGNATVGGGIYNAGKLEIRYTDDVGDIIINNTATEFGGGIFNTKEASFMFKYGGFSGNTANGENSNLVYYSDTEITVNNGVQYAFIIDDNNTLTAVDLSVASVYNPSDETTVDYYSLADAFENAQSGSTVTLIRDASTPSITLPEDKVLSLYLNGHNISSIGKGSIIINNGTLSIIGSSDGSQIYGGTADNGGNIYNNGTMTITNGVTVRSGMAYENGGNIYNAGDLTLKDCTIMNGTANMGGGIYNTGTLTMSEVTSQGCEGEVVTKKTKITKNYARYDFGGGIFNTKEATLNYNAGDISNNTGHKVNTNLVYYSETKINMSIGSVESTYIIDDDNNLTEVEYVPETGSVFSSTPFWMIIAGTVVILTAAVVVIVWTKKKVNLTDKA